MTNGIKHFFEGFHLSPELEEKVKRRWNVIYYATENEHNGELVDHGSNFLQHDQPATPAETQSPINAAQIGSNVFDLATYREQQEYSESLQMERLAMDARQMEEEARRESAA